MVFTGSADSVSKSPCLDVLCLCVTSRKTLFSVDWRLQVEERIANSGILRDVFQVFAVSMNFSGHNWGVCREGSLTVAPVTV